jgi:hypothetical protein
VSGEPAPPQQQGQQGQAGQTGSASETLREKVREANQQSATNAQFRGGR